MNPRVQACLILNKIAQRKCNLTQALSEVDLSSKDAGLVQELCYGVMRWWHQLDFLVQQFLARPLKAKDCDIQLLLFIGLYQIIYLRVPDHAAVSTVVAAAKTIKKPWAARLINAVLRQFLRQSEKYVVLLNKNIAAKYSHPPWLLTQLQNAWPNAWENILVANNVHPPLSLRLNPAKTSIQVYLQELEKVGIVADKHPYVHTAVVLKQAVAVEKIPGFTQGIVSVQDVGAQLATNLLELQPNLRVLDACAAPGGKIAHCLEIQPNLDLMAIDIDSQRCALIHANLQRLNLHASVKVADASQPQEWWNGNPFDRILLDAPCSATGVIRRHPDIKYLRQAQDIAKRMQIQNNLLQALWPLVKVDGLLLYVTCSILPAENAECVEKFLHANKNAGEIKINADWGVSCTYGRQILPGETNMDGFYFCKIRKKA